MIEQEDQRQPEPDEKRDTEATMEPEAPDAQEAAVDGPDADEAPEETADAPEEAVDEPEKAPEVAADTSDAPTDAPEEPAEPAPPIGPKERRRQARSQHAGEARPERGPEERAAERAERRRGLAATRRAWRARQREKRAAAPRAEAPPLTREQPSGRPKVRQGVVISDRADKTITVRIDLTRQHREYKKVVRQSSMLHAHDERNEASAGDTVRLVESRPLSRTKRWRLVEVLERAR